MDYSAAAVPTSWQVEQSIATQEQAPYYSSAPLTTFSDTFALAISDTSLSQTGVFVFGLLDTAPQLVIDQVEAPLSWKERLSRVQKGFGLNVSQLAACLKVSRQQLYNWRSDEVDDPSLENQASIDRLYALFRAVEDEPHLRFMGKLAKRKVFAGDRNFIEAIDDEFSEEEVRSGLAVLRPDLARFAEKAANRSTQARSKDALDDISAYS